MASPTDMFRIAMKGDWEQMVKIYKDDAWAHKAKISTSGDTALHIAVSNKKEHTVEELVRLICEKDEEHKEALKIQDERGNTPLHLAAMAGSVKMCMCIAGVDSKLVGARNLNGETPFFLAALHGKKEAFLCLHYKCSEPDKGYSYCRRNDGDTILHCAIGGDYFDLAYQIIQLYEKLVHSVSEKGKSPLHLLAEQPFSFESGIFHSWWNMIIYNYCIFVDKLKPEPLPITFEDEKNRKTYQTCTNFFLYVRKMIRGETNREGGDAEDPGARHQETTRKGGDAKDPGARHQGLSKVIKRLKNQKETHTWSVQILDELLQRTEMYNYEHNGKNPKQSVPQSWENSETMPNPQQSVPQSWENSETTPPYDTAIVEVEQQQPTLKEGDLQLKIVILKKEEKKSYDMSTKSTETAILIAAKNGVQEVVEKILEKFPVAIYDEDSNKRNIVLLAVESRQSHLYEFLCKRIKILQHIVFRKIDNKGNSALHLAAAYEEKNQPWRIPGLPLRMQWEIKWYKFVKDSMPRHFFALHNDEEKTAEDIFIETHKGLAQLASTELSDKSNSYAGFAAGIAAITFATSTTMPGDSKEETGASNLEHKPALFVYSMSSLIALSASVTAMILFLSIVTSRQKEKDFTKALPRKLLLGFLALFISIASTLISFYAGHFFVLKDQLNFPVVPIYVVMCLPVTYFTIAQLPFYLDFMLATVRNTPQRRFPSAPLYED